jgi:hypothetical protein
VEPSELPEVARQFCSISFHVRCGALGVLGFGRILTDPDITLFFEFLRVACAIGRASTVDTFVR